MPHLNVKFCISYWCLAVGLAAHLPHCYFTAVTIDLLRPIQFAVSTSRPASCVQADGWSLQLNFAALSCICSISEYTARKKIIEVEEAARNLTRVINKLHLSLYCIFILSPLQIWLIHVLQKRLSVCIIKSSITTYSGSLQTTADCCNARMQQFSEAGIFL